MASSKAVRLRKRKHILKRHQTEKLHCYTDNHQDTKRDATLVTRKKKWNFKSKYLKTQKELEGQKNSYAIVFMSSLMGQKLKVWIVISFLCVLER